MRETRKQARFALESIHIASATGVFAEHLHRDDIAGKSVECAIDAAHSPFTGERLDGKAPANDVPDLHGTRI
jgi:hypothetical protein